MPIVKRDSTLAIISLIAGLVGWVLPLVGGIVAVVTGHLARKEIRENPNTLTGDGMAVAGLVLGYVHIGIIITIIVVLALFIHTTGSTTGVTGFTTF
jgi:hypothetical protein